MGRSGVEARTLTPSLSAPRVMVILIATLTRDLPSYPQTLNISLSLSWKTESVRQKASQGSRRRGKERRRSAATCPNCSRLWFKRWSLPAYLSKALLTPRVHVVWWYPKSFLQGQALACLRRCFLLGGGRLEVLEKKERFQLQRLHALYFSRILSSNQDRLDT